jgi:transcription initiation factor TFIIH subunit 1
LLDVEDKAYSRNKKSGLSNSIQPDEDDIYNEIDMEDLRGPAVDTTIRLDVQEKDDEMEGDDGQVARGIVSGKSQEVRDQMRTS